MPDKVISVCTHPDGDGLSIDGAREDCFCGEFWGELSDCQHKPAVYVLRDALLSDEAIMAAREALLEDEGYGTGPNGRKDAETVLRAAIAVASTGERP